MRFMDKRGLIDLENEKNDKIGKLSVCPTPIGNLEDITLRTLRILEEADIVAAEDTRHTVKLLNHFNLSKKLVSYHEHNKRTAGPKLVEKIKQGSHIAIVSDAGMPGISDPGADLIQLCIQEELPVEVLPGATALIQALVASGFSTNGFMFVGFIDRNKQIALKQLNQIKHLEQTLIFYEAPHRLQATLKCLREGLGNRKVALCRELTKRYETIKRLSLDEAILFLEEEAPRGEYVLIIEGDDGTIRKEIETIHQENQREAYEVALKEASQSGEKLKEAASRLAGLYEQPKNKVYQDLLALK